MVGYDGSDAATRALDVAADLVGYGSTLAVVTVRTTESDHSVTERRPCPAARRLVEARYHETSGEPAKQLVEEGARAPSRPARDRAPQRQPAARISELEGRPTRTLRRAGGALAVRCSALILLRVEQPLGERVADELGAAPRAASA